MDNYTPSPRFGSVQTLLANHFYFTLLGLPDLSQFVQSVLLPSVACTPASGMTGPFVKIPQVGDHLDFAPFTVNFLIDNQFLAYYSLFYWLSGTGFPTGYDDIANFAAFRKTQLANPRPLPREIFKTTGILTLLQPDTDKPLVDIVFEDCFPTMIGDLTFTTVPGDAPQLSTSVAFHYTRFEPRLHI